MLPLRPLATALIVSTLVTSALVAAPQDSFQRQRVRSVPPGVEAARRTVFDRYAAGDDLAVERWLGTPAGRTELWQLESAGARDTGGWSRARSAFQLEVAIALVENEPVSTPDRLRAGFALLASRPARLGSNPVEDRFEFLWYQTALGVAQGIRDYKLQREFLYQIEPRWEEALHRHVALDTRLPLARAIAAEGLCCAKDNALKDVVKYFDVAADEPGLRAEALIRAGVLLQARGHHEDALARLSLVPPYDDGALTYVHQLTYGRVLDAAHRPSDAITAYRAALKEVPLGQRAAIGLAAALLRSGHTDEATQAAAMALQLPADPVDHARDFLQADWRFVRGWLQEIRRLRR